MSKVVEKLASEGLLTNEEIEKIGSSVHDFLKAMEADPDFANQVMNKLAGPAEMANPTFWSRFKGTLSEAIPTSLAVAGSAALLGGVNKIVEKGVSSVTDAVGKARAYQNMMDSAEGLKGDQLREMPAELTQKVFNTLYTVNPTLAKDPFLAQEFVLTTGGREGVNWPHMKTIVDIEKSLKDIHRPEWPQYQQMVGTGLQASKNIREMESEKSRAQDLLNEAKLKEQRTGLQRERLGLQEAQLRESQQEDPFNKYQQYMRARENFARLMQAQREGEIVIDADDMIKMKNMLDEMAGSMNPFYTPPEK